MNAIPKTTEEIKEYFEKSNRFSEIRNAKLTDKEGTSRSVQLIGLFGTLTIWEKENIPLKPLAKKGNTTYYEM